MEKYTVLICDDNRAVHGSLKSCLEADGTISVISTFDGEAALKKLWSCTVDLIVLDIMLPGMDGFEVCRKIRKSSNVYIIMLSARDDELDRIVGLEIGADDYVIKPFSPREQATRIKKILARLYAKNSLKSFTLAELTVLPDTYTAYVGNRDINLSRKEFEVLVFMVENAGKVLTRERILNFAWGTEFYGDTRVVDSLMKRLRQKLVTDDVHFAIHTLYGVGYKIEET